MRTLPDSYGATPRLLSCLVLLFPLTLGHRAALAQQGPQNQSCRSYNLGNASCSANCYSNNSVYIQGPGDNGGGQWDAASIGLADNACILNEGQSGDCVVQSIGLYEQVYDDNCCESPGNSCGDDDPCCSGNPSCSNGVCPSGTTQTPVCTPPGNPGCSPGTMTDCCAGAECVSGSCLQLCASDDDCPGDANCYGQSCGCPDVCDDPSCPGYSCDACGTNCGGDCTTSDDCPGGLVCMGGTCGCSDICDDPSCDPNGNFAADCGCSSACEDPSCDSNYACDCQGNCDGSGDGGDCDGYSDPCCGNWNGGSGNNGSGGGNNGGSDCSCGGLGQFCGLGSEQMDSVCGCCSPAVCDDGGSQECVLPY